VIDALREILAVRFGEAPELREGSGHSVWAIGGPASDRIAAVPRHRESSLLSLARIGTAWIASWVYSTVIKTTTSRRLPARSGPMRSPAGSGERDDPPKALPSCAERVSAPASLLRRG